jgi:membrane protease YdiL (CAAX protease family)
VNPLHERIRRLPAGVEFLVVMSWAFGLPIFSSIMALGTRGESGVATGGALVFNNAALVNIVVFELIQSAFLVWFLRVRGWTLEKVGLSISWRSTGLGWLLLVGTYVLLMGAQALANWIMPAQMQVALQQYPAADPRVSMQLVFLASTVNGIFEELFVAGYIITVLRDSRGTWVAINVSTIVRLLYHLYQGPMAVITIVPLGLLFGYVYARTRLLWPLVLAHVLIDIIGLSSLGRLLEGH